MSQAEASTIINAPIEAVWDMVRDFNALPTWVAGLGPSTIEDGRASDSVGCVRAFHLGDGTPVRERLTMLDDAATSFSYNFETPAFPVENYHATFRLVPVTNGDRTFAHWSATFDEAPGDRGKYEQIVSRDVFASGLASLAGLAKGRKVPEGSERWLGMRPAKVFCSSVIAAPIETVWATVRDFTSMEHWHPELSDMHMLGGVRSDTVGGVRSFRLGDGELHEQLTRLCDRTRALHYRITRSPMPWLNYHAAVQLHPVTDNGTTFGVWTADWTASPNDDVRLIPMVHADVFQLAFDTLAVRLGRA